jgi:hypothetical protein
MNSDAAPERAGATQFRAHGASSKRIEAEDFEEWPWKPTGESPPARAFHVSRLRDDLQRVQEVFIEVESGTREPDSRHQARAACLQTVPASPQNISSTQSENF